MAGLVGLLLVLASGPALASERYQKCPGKVKLDFGDIATKIRAKGLTCKKAKRVIKAPATDLGFSCKRIGPGGNTGRIRCTKGDKGVKFNYSQS